MKHFGRTARWYAAVLAVVICFSLLFTAAFATEIAETTGDMSESIVPEGNATVDFILVLDCSGSLRQTDPHYLCSTACKMFLDMVPLENARIGILAFGYGGGEAYTLTGRTIENPLDMKKVHLISDLEEASAFLAKQEVKSSVDTAVRSAGDKTPIGTAAMAAIDLLETNKSADGNACVILLTDGGVTADQSYITDEKNAYSAAEIAKSHQWPIYTMQLNDGKRNGDKAEETVFMKAIAEKSGAEDGHCHLTDFTEGNTEVASAFLNIFNRFMFGGTGNVDNKIADAAGMVESTVEIPNLTSESTIVVSGKSLAKVEIRDTAGNVREITSDVEDKNIVASVVPGSYICTKLICPTPGTWTIRAYGDPNASISMYDCSMKDFDMVLNADISDPNKVFSKSEAVSFSAYFAYHGIEVLTNDYYSQKQPKLVATSVSTGRKFEFPMESTDNGYNITLPLSQISAGEFKIEARLDDGMFRNGSKYSNAVKIVTENLPISISNAKMSNLKGNVNGQFEAIDLHKHVNNPDGDQLYVSMVCTSDRSKTFTTSVDEKGYLTIDCGTQEGTFDVQLSVKDIDMVEYLELDPFTVEVENRKFSFSGVPTVELWIDSYGFQKDTKPSATINLMEYYNDPDGMMPTFGDLVSAESGTIFDCTQNGTVLELMPLAKGDGEITFTVSDGLTTTEETIKVKVVSGKTIFHEQIGIYVIIAAAIIFVIAIILVIISKNTRVKGVWMMTLQDDWGTGAKWRDPLDITMLKLGKKKKFTLGELFNATNTIGLFDGEQTDPDVLSAVSSVLLGGEAKEIILRGVVSGKGCQLQNVPNTTLITVTCNGQPVEKKIRMRSGATLLTLAQPGDGTKYTIILELVH